MKTKSAAGEVKARSNGVRRKREKPYVQMEIWNGKETKKQLRQGIETRLIVELRELLAQGIGGNIAQSIISITRDAVAQLIALDARGADYHGYKDELNSQKSRKNSSRRKRTKEKEKGL